MRLLGTFGEVTLSVALSGVGGRDAQFLPLFTSCQNFGSGENKKLVRRLIRSRATGMYLQENGTWTKKLQEAKCFPGVETVLSAFQQHNLRDCDLVLQFEDEPSSYDIVLPLGQ